MQEIEINTTEQVQFVDITLKIQNIVDEYGIKDGICTVFSPHTTAAVTINENADPDVRRDMEVALNKM